MNMKAFYAGSALCNAILSTVFFFSGQRWYVQLALAVIFTILFYITGKQVDFSKFPVDTYVSVRMKAPIYTITEVKNQGRSEVEEVTIPRKFTARVAENTGNSYIGIDVDLQMEEPIYIVIWEHRVASIKKIKRIAPKDIYSGFLKEK